MPLNIFQITSLEYSGSVYIRIPATVARALKVNKGKHEFVLEVDEKNNQLIYTKKRSENK